MCMFQLYRPFITAPICPSELPLLVGGMDKHDFRQRAACTFMGLALEVFEQTGWVAGA